MSVEAITAAAYSPAIFFPAPRDPAMSVQDVAATRQPTAPRPRSLPGEGKGLSIDIDA